MNVAIVGAGLAGLSAAWHLLQLTDASITLFDKGGSTPIASTGLLHPFPGKGAQRSWQAEEGMQATSLLIAESERVLGRSVADRRGLLRLATPEQRQAMIGDPDVVANEDSTLYIPRGLTVYPKLYLEGLLLSVQQKGARLEPIGIQHLEELKAFDLIILAAGADTLQFGTLPLKKTKGQALLCRTEEPPPMALLAEGHITPTEDPSIWQVGSTYERHFTTEGPEEDKAFALIDKVAQFYPAARDFEILEVRAGVRISPHQGYRPFYGRVGPKTWAFTGLGSRGLLYHASLGKALAEEIKGTLAAK